MIMKNITKNIITTENIFKNIKKSMFAIAAAVMLVTGIGEVLVQAADNTVVTKDYVTDEADIFTDEEERKLQKMCEDASQKCKCDIAIITLETGKDYSVLDNYIRDIINQKYGYNNDGGTPDAMVYAIDMVSRADRIITSGIAQTDISQEDLDYIRINAEEWLADGEYYEGCKSYIDNTMRELYTNIWYRLTLDMPIKIIIAAVIAVIAVLIMMYSAKSKMTVNSGTYTDRGFRVNRKEDRFINTTVVKRHIESSSSRSGGGGRSGGGNSGSSGGHF